MTNPVPEMPDCTYCRHFSNAEFGYPDRCMATRKCTNGSEFKPAEPIRLYTITSEDKT